MRFIGNKTNIVDHIYEAIVAEQSIQGDRFFDFFAGTASVGKYFREKKYKVGSSDILYFSYVLQRAYIQTSVAPDFARLLRAFSLKVTLRQTPYEVALEHLNRLEGVEGFIYSNYTDEGTRKSGSEHMRMYFTPENGQRIDAIRITIEAWREQKLLNEPEYFILLATLIESVPFYANISGVYAAFLKNYDPRAKKDLVLRPIELSLSGTPGLAVHGNSMEKLSTLHTDILYLDPPYNARQYAPNYHLLETIARYDNPRIKGVSGMRAYDNQKSSFCNAKTALSSLAAIVEQADYSTLILSYNSEGIMPQSEILQILSGAGKTKLVELEYRRFKSNSNGPLKSSPYVSEQLYILQTERAQERRSARPSGVPLSIAL